MDFVAGIFLKKNYKKWVWKEKSVEKKQISVSLVKKRGILRER